MSSTKRLERSGNSEETQSHLTDACYNDHNNLFDFFIVFSTSLLSHTYILLVSQATPLYWAWLARQLTVGVANS